MEVPGDHVGKFLQADCVFRGDYKGGDMHRKRHWILRVLTVSLLLIICSAFLPLWSTAADLLPTIETRITMDDWLVLPNVNPEGRPPFPHNPITSSIVQDTWRTPAAGDAVDTDPGRQAVWVPMQSPADSPLESELLLGGWATTRVFSQDRRRAILRARGHTVVYVNGVPRVGNVYRYDYMMIPVVLDPGDNEFLFRCVRYGTLEAWLEPASAPVMINTGDSTLPEAIRGELREYDAGIVVINTTTIPRDLAAAQGSGDPGSIRLPHYMMPSLSITKVAVKLPARRAEGEKIAYEIRGDLISPVTIEVDIVEADLYRNITFISEIEGSVQYFGFRPPRRPNDGLPPALMLHLHGAGDQAYAYRTLYHPKTWCAIASATNRRPFGFNWENWGRIDAMEVLDHATRLANADPSRIYLGGHSMGGHGVWINGAIYPDRFAAIGPGAGWQDIWSYGGATHFDNPTPVEQILNIGANPGRPALLADNYRQMGIMMIHGDADNVVSIEEAYGMRDILEAHGHYDWTMVIEPGGGHVYDTTPEVGHSCFDQIDLFEFFQRHRISSAPRRVDFTTVLPAINDSCHWLRIEQQTNHSEPSRAQLQLDPGRRHLFGTLDNITRFSIDPAVLIEPGQLTYRFDEQGDEKSVNWTGDQLHFHLTRRGWRTTEPLDPAEKGPHRGGSVKTVLMGNYPLLVVGTGGTAEENAWALQKARFDNETMWYRANSSFPIILDTEFDHTAEPHRNVLLYGNADTNSAWGVLLADSPISVHRGEIRIDGHTIKGDDLAGVAIRPRPGSDIAAVGFIAGTGLVGMRTLDALPILYSPVFHPDFMILDSDCWQTGVEAVLATGFFGNDWSLTGGRIEWGEDRSR
jgi:poly(3-hydroxybutyrate) depolymerase